MKNIDIVFFDAASGHRSAAMALQKAIQMAEPLWKVRVINIVDIFDYHRSFGWTVRKGIAIFNHELKKDKVFDLNGKINLALLCHDLVFQKGIQSIAKFWDDTTPDAVISVTPMYNPVLYRAAREANPAVTCITLPVDFEEAKPRYWFTPKVPQYYFNATKRLMDQAKQAGITDEWLVSLPGMIVDPDCYQTFHMDKKAVLASLGLDPDLPTCFLSFGGQGSRLSMEIARAMEKERLSINVLFFCGKNEQLYKDLTIFKTVYPKAVFSYVAETPLYYLHLSDVAIGKPGAMTITEALVTETPLIALRSTGLRPVQKGNEEWLCASGTGLLAENVQDVTVCLKQILDKKDFFKQNTRQHTHRSIFICVEKLRTLFNTR